jgi:hypothetical protein
MPHVVSVTKSLRTNVTPHRPVAGRYAQRCRRIAHRHPDGADIWSARIFHPTRTERVGVIDEVMPYPRGPKLGAYFNRRGNVKAQRSGIALPILICPGCHRGRLGVPDGRRGKVTCPRCGAEWFHPETIELSEIEFRCSQSGARFVVQSSR